MVLEYDIACANYFASSKIIQTPLVSWGFYQNGFSDQYLVNTIQKQWSKKIDFLAATKDGQTQVLITDASFKIVFATSTLADMNGYVPAEVLGKSPGFFQGEGTCPETKKVIKKALLGLQPFKEVILNYKKNGETYWCEIDAQPKFDANGNFLNYIAVERLVA